MSRTVLLLKRRGGAVVIVDLATGGTFTRSSEGSYYLGAPTDGSSAFLAWAATDVRRIENRGDGNGSCLLMEGSRINYLVRSRAVDHADWTAGVATLTANANGGPDNATLADRINASSGQYGPYRISPGPAGLVIASAWVRAVSGAGTHQIVLLHATATAAIAARALATSTTYGRNDASGTATTNSGMISLDARDHSGIGGQAAAAQDVYQDLTQLEQGNFPSSAIRTDVAPVTRAADILAIASGSYDADILPNGFQVTVCPDFSSADLDAEAAALGSAERRICTVGSAGDYLAFRSETMVTTACVQLVSTSGGTAVIRTGTWSRGQALTITAKPTANKVVLSGFTTGDGTTSGATGSGWATGQTLYIGADHAGGSPFFGRFVGSRLIVEGNSVGVGAKVL